MSGNKRRDGAHFGPFMCALGTLEQRARGKVCERRAQHPQLVEGGCDWQHLYNRKKSHQELCISCCRL